MYISILGTYDFSNNILIFQKSQYTDYFVPNESLQAQFEVAISNVPSNLVCEKKREELKCLVQFYCFCETFRA